MTPASLDCNPKTYTKNQVNNVLECPCFRLAPCSRTWSRLDNDQGLNPPAYVASSPTFADSPHHIDGRYQFGGGGSASGLPQASWNGGGSYYRASHPHVPPSHTIPRDLVTYTSDAGQVHDHENESWSVSIFMSIWYTS